MGPCLKIKNRRAGEVVERYNTSKLQKRTVPSTLHLLPLRTLPQESLQIDAKKIQGPLIVGTVVDLIN